MINDPVRQAVAAVLQRLENGERVTGSVEGPHLDLKEEAGRRNGSKTILPGTPRSNEVAKQLAQEASCMANTPGGGALIVGVADDGELVGAATDADWLRKRIYELTDRRLTVECIEQVISGVRLLIIVAPEALEPIRYGGRIRWRVGDSCVEIDAAAWHARRLDLLNFDWSEQSSEVGLDEVRARALEIARDYLRDRGDSKGEDLANAHDADLLRRLGLLTPTGKLTNAGAIAFTALDFSPVDYLRREYAGGDSLTRMNRKGISAIEALHETFQLLDVYNPVRHVQAGLVMRQLPALPRLAMREAVVNGMTHRNWQSHDSTLVEHIGGTLRVTSPGGFVGGVNETNIISHPSRSRNASLAHLFSLLGIAEREGIGVDRMVREMLRLGYSAPVFSQLDAAVAVRTTLIGDAPDKIWIEFLDAIEPATAGKDLNQLIILDALARKGWVELREAAAAIQLPRQEAELAIRSLTAASFRGERIIQPVKGAPAGSEPVWCLGTAVRKYLERGWLEYESARHLPDRTETALSYARYRGRISSTELGSIMGVQPSNLSATLKHLAEQGDLAPSNESGRGQGFHYLAVEPRP